MAACKVLSYGISPGEDITDVALQEADLAERRDDRRPQHPQEFLALAPRRLVWLVSLVRYEENGKGAGGRGWSQPKTVGRCGASSRTACRCVVLLRLERAVSQNRQSTL